MNKKKNDVWNLVFSAFLVTAFLICASFFIGMINDSFTQDSVKRTLLTALIFVLFGLLLFYATRVGDGRQVGSARGREACARSRHVNTSSW